MNVVEYRDLEQYNEYLIKYMPIFRYRLMVWYPSLNSVMSFSNSD